MGDLLAGFEVFHRPKAGREQMMISVQKNAMIRLSAAAYRALDRPATVELLFDKDTQQMAIRRSRGEGTTYPVHHSTSGTQINVASYLDYYGIQRNRQYPARLCEGMLVADTAIEAV